MIGPVHAGSRSGPAAGRTADVYAPRVLCEVERTGLFGNEVRPSTVRTDTDRLLALFGRERRRI